MMIKKATLENLEEIFKIEKSVFAHPWSLESLKNLLEDENSVAFVAVDNETICGYCGVNTILDEGYITNVAVLENYRKQGIGRMLVNALVNFAKDKSLAFLTLEVRKSNTPAINLYSKSGFETVGERKNYYTSPTENALLMTKYF